jgi:hypothetical protein
MKITVANRCSDFDSYRAARVKSLFNAETGANFDLEADLDIDDGDWQIGVVVGPSGSGKTSIGRTIFGGDEAFWTPEWPSDAPLIDGLGPDADFNDVTAALGSVGLGTVPTWLRPYPVLSNGEKFRADLARLIIEGPDRAVVDEFTSVVDRADREVRRARVQQGVAPHQGAAGRPPDAALRRDRVARAGLGVRHSEEKLREGAPSTTFFRSRNLVGRRQLLAAV